MLEIKNLHATVEGKEILKGINLTVKPGEIHVLMGPNGSGKSTLSNVLVGNPQYTVTEGSVTFRGKDLLQMPAEDRSHEGLFMSFQQPVEIPGVSMNNFMRAALNAKLPLVFITSYGFTQFSHPGHQYYDACAEGRLLLLAPWPHQNRKEPLTRTQCLQLNSFAQEICQHG